MFLSSIEFNSDVDKGIYINLTSTEIKDPIFININRGMLLKSYCIADEICTVQLL